MNRMSHAIAETSKPKVAVLLSGREAFSAYYGGALARWTYEVYRCLQGELEVKVFGFPTPPEDAYALPHATSRASRICSGVARIPFLRRYEDWLWLRALISQLRRFDVVHIHNRPQWAFLLRDLGYRGAVIVHLQNDHLGHWNGASLDTLENAVDAVVVCSAYLRNTFSGKSQSLCAKTHVVFNGVNIERFRPREEIREPKTIFFVGRFHPEKGILQLVETYTKVLKEHPDSRLVIGGTTGFGTHEETPYVRQVRDLARKIEGQGGDIRFTGYIHHDRDLPAWFQRATIFCCPSLFQEPFGLVNAEALACATSVVASDRGGIAEVIGDAGCLVNPEDIDAHAASLCALLRDSRRRGELGQAGVERVKQRFDWRVIAKQWTAILERVGKGAKPAMN